MATAVAPATSHAVAPAASEPVSENPLFKTSFLRDGSSGKSFAIVQANESVNYLEYTVYERSTDTFGNSLWSGSLSVQAPTFSFIITKGSTYFIVATLNNDPALKVHFTVDPNKRRLGITKKRPVEDAAAAPAAALEGGAGAAAPAEAVPAAEKRAKKVKA
jgi:hypothetical protein